MGRAAVHDGILYQSFLPHRRPNKGRQIDPCILIPQPLNCDQALLEVPQALPGSIRNARWPLQPPAQLSQTRRLASLPAASVGLDLLGDEHDRILSYRALLRLP